MKTGRPPHQPDSGSRRLVEHHAAIGTPHQQIAKLLQLSLNTLKKHYPEELELGLARANAVVGGTLFTEAKKGNITACIFWMKTRAGWRETARIEHAGVPGEPIETRAALADLTAEERDALRPILERRILESQRRSADRPDGERRRARDAQAVSRSARSNDRVELQPPSI